MTFTVSNYPPEGASMSWDDRQVMEFATLEEARAECKRRLGNIGLTSPWGGVNNDVEAYCAHPTDPVLGGVAISIEE